MKIKILRSSEPHYWYSTYIGQEFKVYSEEPDDYCVEDHHSMLVGKDDCEVIEA